VFVALGEMRMRHIVICGLPPLPLYSIFPHYLINGAIFGNMLLKVKTCVLIYSTNLPETFLIPRRVQQDVTTNGHTSSCNLPVVLVIFYRNLNFLDRFSRNTQISISCKSESRVFPCGQTDGQT